MHIGGDVQIGIYLRRIYKKAEIIFYLPPFFNGTEYFTPHPKPQTMSSIICTSLSVVKSNM